MDGDAQGDDCDVDDGFRTVAVLDDLNGNGSVELAVLVQDDSSATTVRISDTETGVLIRTIEFLSDDWAARGIISINGIGQNTGPAVGIVAVRKSDALPIVQVKDAVNGSLIRNVFPLSARWAVIGAETISNATSEPILAVVAKRSTDGLMVVQLRSPTNNLLIRNIYPLGFGWTPLALSVLNVNGAAAVAVLASRDSDNLTLVQVRRVSDGDLIRNVFPLGLGWTALELTVLPDVDGNGADEIAVRMSRDIDGLEVVQIRDSSTQSFIRNLYPLPISAGWTTVGMTQVPNNGSPALAILSVRASDGQMLVQIREAFSGNLVRNSFFIGPPWQPYASAGVVHVNTNSISSIAVFAQNTVNGDRIIQVRDEVAGGLVSNLQVPRTLAGGTFEITLAETRADPFSAVEIHSSALDSESTYIVDFDVGSGITVAHEAEYVSSELLRVEVPPGRYDKNELFVAGAVSFRVIATSGSDSVVSNEVSIDINPLPLVDPSGVPGTSMSMLLQVAKTVTQNAIDHLSLIGETSAGEVDVIPLTLQLDELIDQIDA
ncbi:MAG: hypothetical protein AAF497_15075, partial [Planctomycetota bacterium]